MTYGGDTEQIENRRRRGKGRGADMINKKKRTSGIVCIFKGTNPVNGTYWDLLLRLCALWQIRYKARSRYARAYLERTSRFRGT